MLVIVAAIVTASVPLLLVAYNKIRPYFSVRVKCWFCGKRTVVPYGNFNCWDCPNCEQYNGFQADGDYNKPIPSQYDESLNFTYAGANNDSCSDGLHIESKNGLCPTCNYNQLVKIRLLANFTPLEEENYNSEVDAYKAHLERVYGMCHECSLLVQRRLMEQDSFLWPQVRDFWLASGSFLQSHVAQDRLTLVAMVITGMMSSVLASLLLLGMLEKIAFTAVSPFFMKVCGTTLAFGSVLLAGRDQFGPVDLLLCWFWFVLHLLSVPCISSAMEEEQMQRLQLLVAGAATLFAVARLVLWTTRLKSKRSWDFRRLTRIKESTSPPDSGNACTLTNATDSKPVGSRCFTETSESRTQRKATEDKSALHDMIEEFHISPESAKQYSPHSDSSSNRSQAPSYTGRREENEKQKRPLLWPPKLQPPSSSNGSWMVGGAWVIGGGLSGGTPQIDWGVKQAYGMLTPPPSRNGSTVSFHTAVPPKKAIYESFQTFGNPNHAKTSWINLKSQADPQNFYSATKNKPLMSSRTTDFTRVCSHGNGWASRSLRDVSHQSTPGQSRWHISGSAVSSPFRQQNYAYSSVSQDTCCEQSRTVDPQVSGDHRGSLGNKHGRLILQTLLVSFSVVTNVLLFTYFVNEPAARPAWLDQFFDQIF